MSKTRKFYASFDGVPNGASHASTVNIDLTASFDVSHYLYAFGEAASTDCSSVSYSSAQAVAATMSLDQSSYADNTQVKLCVRLQSLGGTSTDASDAYEMTWNKSIAEGIYTENNHIIIGGNSGDTLIGGLGGDTITGGTGDDTIYPDGPDSDSSYGGYIEYLRNNASMVLWLDGSDPLGIGTPPSDGAHVATWDDKSVSGFDMPATSMPAYYSDGIGGRGAIRFDGVDDHYELAYRASLNAATQDVFVVGQKSVEILAVILI